MSVRRGVGGAYLKWITIDNEHCSAVRCNFISISLDGSWRPTIFHARKFEIIALRFLPNRTLHETQSLTSRIYRTQSSFSPRQSTTNSIRPSRRARIFLSSLSRSPVSRPETVSRIRGPAADSKDASRPPVHLRGTDAGQRAGVARRLGVQ